MPEGKPIKITPAKGRPMLTWVGKRPLSQVTAFPAQHVETYDPCGGGATLPSPARRGAGGEAWANWPDRYPRGGLLFHGD
ncbi:MAG: site-specific DNA-methyltransferase, partial [Armatimonadota bacterium]